MIRRCVHLASRRDAGTVVLTEEMRSLSNIRWLVEHGFGPIEEMPEVAVLRSQTD